MKKINNLFLLTVASAGGSGITAVFWFIMAALLVPSEYGEIQYFLSIAAIGSVISLIGTPTVVTVYVSKNYKIESTLYFIVLLVAVISSVIVILLVKFNT